MTLINEAIMLLRPILEKTINYFYLTICDDGEFQRYHFYTKQKVVRSHDKSISIGGFEARLSSNITKDEFPDEYKRAFAMFTSKKGKEITRWTSKSIKERLEIILKKSSVKLDYFVLLILTAYDDASEALHGTLYGCFFHIGTFNSGFDPKDFAGAHKNDLKHGQFMIMQMSMMMNSIVRSLSLSEDSSEHVKNFDKVYSETVKITSTKKNKSSQD